MIISLPLFTDRLLGLKKLRNKARRSLRIERFNQRMIEMLGRDLDRRLLRDGGGSFLLRLSPEELSAMITSLWEAKKAVCHPILSGVHFSMPETRYSDPLTGPRKLLTNEESLCSRHPGRPNVLRPAKISPAAMRIARDLLASRRALIRDQAVDPAAGTAGAERQTKGRAPAEKEIFLRRRELL